MLENNPSTTGAQLDQVEEARQLTYGEKLVGVNFNPSNDDSISTVKKLFAEIADIVNNEIGVVSAKETTAMQQTLFHHTIGEILNAQMNVVKLLTLKY